MDTEPAPGVENAKLSGPSPAGNRSRIAGVHVHLDPVGGVAGDMFAAALLDAFPGRAEALAAGLAKSRLHEIVTVRSEPFTDGVLRGLRFHATPAPGARGIVDTRTARHEDGHEDGHEHELGQDGAQDQGQGTHGHSHHDAERHSHHPRPAGHHSTHPHDNPAGRHSHAHRRFADIRTWLRESRLPGPVTERATAIFTALAEAEAQVHGLAVADVTFHEVGAWDSIADIVCAAWLIDSLGPATWSCAPLPLGGGQVRTAHGLLPVPAPATVLLLRGMPVHHDGAGGERITPTGAAILRHLDPAFEPTGLAGRISRAGHGFGSRRVQGMSNVLRALVLDTSGASSAWREETVGVCSFEVDDQTAEDLAVGLGRLRATDGVLDVVQTPAFGKKGRMVAGVRVLARPAARERVIERCFAETTTLGVRWQAVRRATLEREEAVAAVAGEPIRVKRSHRPGGGVTAKAEMDDLARRDDGRAEREARRRQAESE